MKKIALSFIAFVMLLTVPVQASAATLYEIRKIIQSDYYGEVTGDIYDAQTINELMSMIKDPYTVYFTQDEYRSFYQSIEQETVGIGVVVNAHEKGIFISEIINGGPAANAGIRPGDIITHANGQSLVGLPLNEAVSFITGAENTTVNLQLLRSDGSSTTLSLVRKTIQTPNVVSSMLYGQVGYIHLASFSENGALEVSRALRKLKQDGAKEIILDIQNNGGGYVNTAIDLMSMFPKATYAFQLIDNRGKDLLAVDVYKSYQANSYEKFPNSVALLINGASASASDMLAAAAKDQKFATLYGKTTYGKGSMQNIEEFRDGSALKVTIAEFRSPNGNIINHVGVKPDVDTSSPLQTAHFDMLKKQLTSYKALPALTNVPTSKTFTVTFSKAVKESSLANNIELIALGGQKIDIQTTVSANKVTITPKQPLQAGSEYALIVRPSIQNANGKALKNGTYMHITVAK